MSSSFQSGDRTHDPCAIIRDPGEKCGLALWLEQSSIGRRAPGVVMGIIGGTAFLLIGRRDARLDSREIAAASNANCGIATPAAARVLAKRWNSMAIPCILCGTFGYGIANFIGIGLGTWPGG